MKPTAMAISGVGLKPAHVPQIMEILPELGFFEVHAENYMGAGGPPHRHLTAIRAHYPLSIHGVGMSIGGAAPLDRDHLDRLARLVRRYDPILVSEHLAWSSHAGAFLNDLLPLPYTDAALECVVAHVDQVQSALKRRILIENPATYLEFAESHLAETQFIAEIARRTGCGLLLDVNNVHVSSINRGADAMAYLSAFPLHRVEQIHLAGHSVRLDRGGARLLVDSHDAPVDEAVWVLYRAVIANTGPLPSLIERDGNIPGWAELYAEACRAAMECGLATGGDIDIAC